MKKVLTFGVFDYFHYGHLKLFEKASSSGDYLIVAVQEEKYIKKTKPNARILYSTEQRKYMVGALRTVDEVIGYTDVDETIKEIEFDILVVGEDQNHEGFQRAIKWCEDNGKEVIVLKRTKGISSSYIKKEVEDLK